jgi:hypothetical protein
MTCVPELEDEIFRQFSDSPFIESKLVNEKFNFPTFKENHILHLIEPPSGLRSSANPHKIEFIKVEKGDYHPDTKRNIIAIRCGKDDKPTFNFHGFEILPSDDSIMCFHTNDAKIYTFGPVNFNHLDRISKINITRSSEIYFGCPLELICMG